MLKIEAPPYIIAEAANNHGGSMLRALQLCDAAREAGADAVKFQLGLDRLCAPTNRYYDTFKGVCLPYTEWYSIAKYCADTGIQFLASAFSLQAVAHLREMGVPVFKMASGDITYHSMLRSLSGDTVILSTGGSDVDEIDEALQVLGKDVYLLQCTMMYPCEDEDANVGGMASLMERFGGCIKGVGYSDHTRTGKASVLAAEMGAMIVEKHFALEETDDSSCDPKTLDEMIKEIRDGYKLADKLRNTLLGDAALGVKECERDVRKAARRNPRTGLRE